MANTFPIHLENQLVVLYGSYVKRLALAITPSLIKSFEKENPELAADSLNEDLGALPEQVEEKDPATSGALVAIGAVLIPKFMFDGINSVLGEVDQWSFMRMRQETIAFERARKVTGLAEQIAQSNAATQQALLTSVKRNAELIKNIRREETVAIASKVKEAVQQGLSTRQLKKNIAKAVNTTASKAEFWARDQVSKVQMDLNFERLSSAGFPAYKWNTSRDARVRPDHIWREGRVFQRGEGIVPGEEPNCRCTPGPAFGESDASSPTERRKTLRAINKDRRTVNGLKKNAKKKPLDILGQAALEEPAA